MMRKWLAVLTVIAAVVMLAAGPAAEAAQATTRIKDIAKIQGVRGNQLVGYGLVSGLNGTGDSTKSVFTIQSMASMLKNFGVAISASQMQTKNMAAVMVTAYLPPFAKPGDTIDISVSSMGDAKSLQGGVLLQTPLKAANGQVYAVGQGALSVGGYAAASGGASQQKNFPTVAMIPGGALVERDVPAQFNDRGSVTLSLNQPDFTTASRIGAAIDYRFGAVSSTPDPGTVVVNVPPEYGSNTVGFVAALEDIYVIPDNSAKVIINERTGTVVIGGNVTIDEVAVAQGGLTVKIGNKTEVSQPPPLSGGSTVVTNNPTVDVQEQTASLIALPASTSVGDVVRSLNAVGATPRDVIAILQAIKASGALHADLQIQ